MQELRSLSTERQCAPIDVDALLKRCLGNAKIVSMILDRFEQHAATDYSSLADAVRAQDLAAVGQRAHCFKGAAGMVSASALAAVVGEVEELANHQDPARIADQLVLAKRELDACLAYLPMARGRLPSGQPTQAARAA